MEILKCEGIKKVYGSGANQVKALDGIDRQSAKNPDIGHYSRIILPSFILSDKDLSAL